MTQPVLRFLVVILALAGLADALYFTFAYYGRVRKSRWVPEILCAREGSSCVTVVQTPYARVFAVPNSLLGIFYYLLLLGWSMMGHQLLIAWDGTVMEVWSLVRLALIATSAVSVLLGFYLIYALRGKLHTDCPMCYLAHAINAALFVLLIWVSG